MVIVTGEGIKFISLEHKVHDVCVTRINKSEIEKSVYRKSTNTNIYRNWYSHASSNCKTGSLRNRQRIHVRMYEMYEMDRKFYTQLVKALIVFFFLR